MKYRYLTLAALCSIAYFSSAPLAQAQHHSVRIDEGNGTGCMSTWTTVSDPSGAAAFSPGGPFGSVVACAPNSSSDADLFPNGLSANEASLASGGGASYDATGGEMFQFYTGAPAVVPVSQVIEWTLANSDTEIEMNGWCSGSATGSFSFGGKSFTGGCGTSASDDLVFNSSKVLIGSINEATNTLVLSSTVPSGWTTTGGGTVTAPEIDPSSAIAALTLLAGGLVVLLGRRDRRSGVLA